MPNYTIQGGDTFSSIASRFNTTVAAIQAANPGVNQNNLQIGQVINLPGGPTGSNRYTIVAGDTFSAIASKFNTTVAAIEAANPGVNPNNLQIGQVINIPSGSTDRPHHPPPQTGKYTIQSGDTFTTIAAKFGTSPEKIQDLNPGVNPNNLQIGQVINVPSGAIHPPPQTDKYTIQAGDTFTSIAAKLGTSAQEIQALNPGVNPNDLQIGQVINIPRGGTPYKPGPGEFVSYSGPASNFPDPSQWADYSSLWAHNSSLMSLHDSQGEINSISQSIQQVSSDSRIDARAILCLIMQESGGNVRVGTTFSHEGVRNAGLMQSHNGVAFDPSNPAGSILQMIRDGTQGTPSGDGLVQCLARQKGNYFSTFRNYNSGSVDHSNLSNGLGATGDYVSKMANRLRGVVWPGM